MRPKPRTLRATVTAALVGAVDFGERDDPLPIGPEHSQARSNHVLDLPRLAVPPEMSGPVRWKLARCSREGEESGGIDRQLGRGLIAIDHRPIFPDAVERHAFVAPDDRAEVGRNPRVVLLEQRGE